MTVEKTAVGEKERSRQPRVPTTGKGKGRPASSLSFSAIGAGAGFYGGGITSKSGLGFEAYPAM